MKNFVITLIFLISANSCSDSKTDLLKRAFVSQNSGYAIVVIKDIFRLEVYSSEAKLIVSYKIGYGSNPDMKAKLYEGDNRTPEGIYHINEILSMDSGKESDSYRKLLNMNRVYFKKTSGYHKFAYPNEDLGDNAYGPRYYGINYPNERDAENYNKAIKQGVVPVVNGRPAGIGYGIAIHGNNDEDSIGHLCSSGCIRMFNRDIVELEKYIMLSTPVVIMRN